MYEWTISLIWQCWCHRHSQSIEWFVVTDYAHLFGVNLVVTTFSIDSKISQKWHSFYAEKATTWNIAAQEPPTGEQI